MAAMSRSERLFALFPRLTAKQHEVLRLVAENRTSKEIAWGLGISESAVNQRIESVRTRADSPPRAELARAYRHYLQDRDEPCKAISDKFLQVAEEGAVRELSNADDPSDDRPDKGPDGVENMRPACAGVPDLTALASDGANVQSLRGPGYRDFHGRVVPEVLDGAHAGLSRSAAMMAIAAGILVVAMVGLGVARALSDLF